MRRRRRPESAALEDQAARLRAERERLEAERDDLAAEMEALEEKRALARHLGRGNEDKIANRLNAVEIRVAELIFELEDLGRALTVLAAEIASARRVEAIDNTIAARKQEQKAAAELEKAETALVRAEARHENAAAALDEAERAAGRAESAAAAVTTAIEQGAADPLLVAARKQEETRKEAERPKRETIAWAFRQILSGSPVSIVLKQIPAELRPEVERRVAEARGPESREERRQRDIASARAKGEGLSIDGEQVVQPKIPAVPPITATRV